LVVGVHRDVRRVAVAASSSVRLAWLPQASPPFLEGISAQGPDHLLVGESQRLAISGMDSQGRTLSIRALRVRSLDPDLLRPVGGDTVLALAPGIATLEIDAGGWRITHHSVSVHASGEPRLAFHEFWTEGIDPVRWRPYGTPSPELVQAEMGGAAMRNNGDDHYPSGLVSVEEFSTTEGLALEWTQRTPLTGDYWQEIWINLLSMPLEEIGTDEGEPFKIPPETPLHLGIPIQLDSPARPTVFGICGSARTPEIPFDSILTRTGWHRIAVQLFPSGGCDLYVDGALVARGRPDEPESWPEQLRLAIGGRSVGADVLIGEVSVHRGVRFPVAFEGGGS